MDMQLSLIKFGHAQNPKHRLRIYNITAIT